MIFGLKGLKKSLPSVSHYLSCASFSLQNRHHPQASLEESNHHRPSSAYRRKLGMFLLGFSRGIKNRKNKIWRTFISSEKKFIFDYSSAIRNRNPNLKGLKFAETQTVKADLMLSLRSRTTKDQLW